MALWFPDYIYYITFLSVKICDIILIFSFGKVRRITVAIFEITNSTTNGVCCDKNLNEMPFSL